MKKAFISADIEGMEGNVSVNQSNRGRPDYGTARKRLAQDVNAAARACFDFGYDEVYVCDGHGDMENLLIEDMDPRVKLISGCMRDSLQMQGIDRTFDAYISFGHAGAGQIDLDFIVCEAEIVRCRDPVAVPAVGGRAVCAALPFQGVLERVADQVIQIERV